MGVLNVTIDRAIRAKARETKRKPARARIITERTGNVPTPQSLVDGSSNIGKCAAAARLFLGDCTVAPLLLSTLRREMGLEDPRCGFMGLEFSTSYLFTHAAADLAIYVAAVRMGDKTLARLALEHFAQIVSLLAAMTRPGTTEPTAMSGTRCVAPECVGAADILEWLMQGRKFQGKTVDAKVTPPKNPDKDPFSALRWLLNEVNDLGGRPEFDAARIWLTDGTAGPLTAELAKIQIGAGHLSVLHYQDADGKRGVATCWPKGLMGPAVGDAKKSARRMYAVVYGDGSHIVGDVTPIGFVAYSEVVDGDGTVSSTYDGMVHAAALPAGEMVVKFDVLREPNSWPAGWQ